MCVPCCYISIYPMTLSTNKHTNNLTNHKAKLNRPRSIDKGLDEMVPEGHLPARGHAGRVDEAAPVHICMVSDVLDESTNYTHINIRTEIHPHTA